MLTQILLGVSLMMAVSPAHAAQKIEVHGHRGARARFPENTLPAFKYALEQGVDVLEMDLAVTKDRHLVISHDPHLTPELCLDGEGHALKEPVLIFSLPLSEVKKYDCGSLKNARFPKQQPVPKTPLPTLEEVFELVAASPLPAAKKVRFNIETKIRPDQPSNTTGPEEFARLLMDVLKKKGMLSRTIVQSFDFRTLVEIRKLDPKTVISALVEEPSVDMLKAARELKAEIVSPKWELLDSGKVARLHSEKVKVVPWTANDAATWQRLADMKVDGIISDDPEELIAWLRSKGLR